MAKRAPPPARQQHIALAALSAVAVAATAFLTSTHGAFFEPYFGDINPVLAALLSAAAGAAALEILRRRGWFEIYSGPNTLRGVGLSAVLATGFAVAAIVADLTLGFRRDINVPFPWSLPFYPAIGFVAEVWLHAVPLAILAIVVSPLFRISVPDRLIWLCMISVSFVEPAFQVWGGLARLDITSLEVFVGVHVFAINVLQIYVFRHYGFVSMYAFRIIYYSYWHIAWGFLRLELMF